jgi:pyruvate/2-oxoglutarate dehydrogenase complex dihydrolipoamide acyltransferase (E2) component
MRSAELIAERRGALRDAAPARVTPAHQVWLEAPLAPVQAMLARLHVECRLPPGLRAEARHLALRAAAQALERHPWFNDFLLLSGGVQHNELVSVRVALDAEGRPAHCTVPNPGRRPLVEVLAELAAREVDESVEAVRRAIKVARVRRSRPVFSWLVSEGVLEPLHWLRDRLPALERRMRRDVLHGGSFGLLDAGPLGATGVAGVLLACHSAALLLASPRPALEAGPRLPVGLVFDARLFEAHEAVAFLREVIELLAEPETRLA